MISNLVAEEIPDLVSEAKPQQKTTKDAATDPSRAGQDKWKKELSRLVNEHTQYAQRLDLLQHKRYLTVDEKLDVVRLKKLKLRLKDQIDYLEQQSLRDKNKLARDFGRILPNNKT